MTTPRTRAATTFMTLCGMVSAILMMMSNQTQQDISEIAQRQAREARENFAQMCADPTMAGNLASSVSGLEAFCSTLDPAELTIAVDAVPAGPGLADQYFANLVRILTNKVVVPPEIVAAINQTSRYTDGIRSLATRIRQCEISRSGSLSRPPFEDSLIPALRLTPVGITVVAADASNVWLRGGVAETFLGCFLPPGPSREGVLHGIVEVDMRFTATTEQDGIRAWRLTTLRACPGNDTATSRPESGVATPARGESLFASLSDFCPSA